MYWRCSSFRNSFLGGHFRTSKDTSSFVWELHHLNLKLGSYTIHELLCLLTSGMSCSTCLFFPLPAVVQEEEGHTGTWSSGHRPNSGRKPETAPCPYCFAHLSIKSLSRHKKDMHGGEKRVHKCSLCDAKLTRLDNLRRHILLRHCSQKTHWLHRTVPTLKDVRSNPFFREGPSYLFFFFAEILSARITGFRKRPVFLAQVSNAGGVGSRLQIFVPNRMVTSAFVCGSCLGMFRFLQPKIIGPIISAKGGFQRMVVMIMFVS